MTSHAPEPLAGLDLRSAMRRLSSGVSVITAGLAPNRTGFTATSVVSLSVDPPRVIVTVNRSSSSYGVIVHSGIFGVNFLASHHEPIANRFAGRGGLKGEQRFEGADWQQLVTGASLLKDALAVIDAEVEELIERHSHAIVIGRVVAARSAERGDALLYWRGRYETSPSQTALAAE